MSGKIIKSDQTGGQIPAPYSPSGGVIRKEELHAQSKAQVILDEAFKTAQKIREEALQLRAQVEKEREAAKRQGFGEGKAEGLEALNAELLKLRELKEKFYAEAEPQIIKLVLDIAAKVIGDITQEYTEAVQSVVTQALEKALGDRITVRLHPDDFARLKDLESAFREKLERSRHLHFKEDETIERGGCVVETEIGTIDARLETQLKAIRKALGV